MENRSSEFGTIPRYGTYASNLTRFYTYILYHSIPNRYTYLSKIHTFNFRIRFRSIFPLSTYRFVVTFTYFKATRYRWRKFNKIKNKITSITRGIFTSYIFNAQLYGVVREDRTISVARLSKKTEKLYRTYTLFPIIIRRITHWITTTCLMTLFFFHFYSRLRLLYVIEKGKFCYPLYLNAR